MPSIKTSKEEIVKQAAVLFRKKGYFNTSVSDLADACGVRNSLLYYYFKDKDELMSDSLKYAHAFYIKKAFKHAYDQELKPKERLAKMTGFIEKMFLGTDKGGCIMALTTMETMYFNPGFIETTREFFNDWMDALTAIYVNKHSKKDAIELAERAVQDIEGGILLTMVYRKEKYLLKALERTKAYLD